MREIHPEHIRKILVREVNWVGDAVLTLPALDALDRRFPGANIAVLGRPWVAGLFGAQPSVDRVIVYDSTGTHRGVTGRYRLARQLRREAFDLALLLPNSVDAALSPWLARIPHRVGYPTDGRRLLLTHPVAEPRQPVERHQVFRYLRLVEALGGHGEGLPHLAVSADALRVVDGLLADAGLAGDAPWIAVNPGSIYGTAKRWPSERFAAAADRLSAALGMQVVLVGSSREADVLEAVAKAMGQPSIVLGGRTDIGLLPALLRRARLLLTNDTGAMHIAAAVGTPVVALFGPTDAGATGPLGSRSRRVRQPVPCSPCLLRECPIDHRCMTGITVDQVVQTAESLLRDSQTPLGPVAQLPDLPAVPSMSGAPAAFLDRDGTIIEDPGYLGDPEGIRFIPGAQGALRALRAAGYRLIVITNQSGVARNMFTEADVRRVNERLQELLTDAGVPLDGVYYCPHHPDGTLSEYRRICACRKPGPGMVEQARKDFGVDLARSVVIGDHLSDMGVARHFDGMRSIMVLTGHGASQHEKLAAGESVAPDHVAPDLASAVAWLLHATGR